MKKIEIYTDGACSGNPGPGGYAGILFYGEYKKNVCGGETQTTNNRMELTAVIESLKALKEPCEVNLYTDSAYVFNAVENNWIQSWQDNNWRGSNKKEVLNKDLWLALIDMLKIHSVKFVKVKGHADNKYNNICDELARKEIQKIVEKNSK